MEVRYTPLWSAEDIVVRFLEAVAAADFDVTAQLLSTDIRYAKSPLPDIQGRTRVMQMLRRGISGRTHFDVEFNEVRRLPCATKACASAQNDQNAGLVYTDRVDVFSSGPVRLRIPVHGTFEVRDKRVHGWFDDVEWGAMSVRVGRFTGHIPKVPARLPLVTRH